MEGLLGWLDDRLSEQRHRTTSVVLMDANDGVGVELRDGSYRAVDTQCIAAEVLQDDVDGKTRETWMMAVFKPRTPQSEGSDSSVSRREIGVHCALATFRQNVCSLERMQPMSRCCGKNFQDHPQRRHSVLFAQTALTAIMEDICLDKKRTVNLNFNIHKRLPNIPTPLPIPIGFWFFLECLADGLGRKIMFLCPLALSWTIEPLPFDSLQAS